MATTNRSTAVVLAALEQAEVDGDEATTAHGIAVVTGLATTGVSAALAALKRAGKAACVTGTRRWHAVTASAIEEVALWDATFTCRSSGA